jgi:glycosyltransferase involved in cell wall biosynthesis
MVSGVSRVVMDLCNGLRERDIDHLVISGRSRDDVEKDEAIEAIEIDISKLQNFSGGFLALKIVINIYKQRNSIDLLHLQSPHLQAMVSAILGKILGKPVITTIHGKFAQPKGIFKRFYFKFIEKGTLVFSDIVTFVDKEAKKYYDIHPSIVIENGIDTDFFSPNPTLGKEIRSKLRLTEEDIVLLYLGRLTASKGIFHLLGAFTDIKNEVNVKSKLLLVGPDEDNISREIKSLRLEKDVLICESTRAIKPYYCTADIFILPSAYEGFPLVLLEASSCGLPIISTRVGGIPSLIKNGENGLLIDYGDINGLKQNIKRLIEDQKLRNNIGDKARKKVIENHNIRITINRYADLYNKVLMEKRYSI